MYFSPRTEKTKIIELSNRIENLQNQLTELTSENSKLKTERVELQNEIATQSAMIVSLKEILNTLQKPISEEPSETELVDEELSATVSEEPAAPKAKKGRKSQL